MAPRLSPTCLRLGSASPKVPRTLLTLDEQVVSGRSPPPTHQPNSYTWSEPSLSCSQPPSPDPDPGLDSDPGELAFQRGQQRSSRTLSLKVKFVDQRQSHYLGAC